ncbi:unnamed protein product [Caenorhabditis angaria]|uniref:GRIP domain-containing protein n=1 Tax=Caenorhabditis angaria TaxID=860376 RepID=A0A9P1N0L8_9PELO|nr:unnamed protein product [Caenorhabditis angaria]
MVDQAKSPIPPAGNSKLDQLSKEDLVKFAKKQVANLAEAKKNQVALVEKLKQKLGELEQIRAENEQLKELKEKSIASDMVQLELRDAESKIDNLNRALREKTEALIKAHEVIGENDGKVLELRGKLGDFAKIQEEKSRILEGFEEEKKKRLELEGKLREAEGRIGELSDKQGNEKMGLARKMAESECRAGLLEEAISVLKKENHDLSEKSDNYRSQLEQIEKEFAEFKNKARAVLETHQNAKSSVNFEKEEIDRLKEHVGELEREIGNLKEDDAKNLENLATEKDRVEKLTRDLERLRRRVEESENSHLRGMDDLRESSSKTIQRLEEDLRILRNSKDSLENKLKDVTIQKEKAEYLLKAEKCRAETEIQGLTAKLESARKLQKSLENRLKFEENEEKPVPKAIVQPQQQQQNLERSTVVEATHEPLSMQSSVAINDSVSCYNEETQQDRSLEDILYGDIEEDYKTESFELNEEKLARLQEELEKMQKTNLHIGELLSEAESANGRLVSQNTLLKEEIRRLERKEERAEELSNEKNMEYLKNVVVQFLKPTTSPAERAQLIIVLQRVLHLSPQETEILKNCQEILTPNTSNSWFGWT